MEYGNLRIGNSRSPFGARPFPHCAPVSASNHPSWCRSGRYSQSGTMLPVHLHLWLWTIYELCRFQCHGVFDFDSSPEYQYRDEVANGPYIKPKE